MSDRIDEKDLPQVAAAPTDDLRAVRNGKSVRVPIGSLPVSAAVDARLTVVEQSQAAGMLGYATLADRPAPGVTGRLARITDDPTPENNGTYRDTGSEWVKVADPTDALAAEVDLKADKSTTPAIATIPEDVFVITDAAGNRSWMEAELGTGEPTTRVGDALRPVLGIEQSIDEAIAPMPRVEAIPGDKFQLVDAQGLPSWIEAELGTGRPTAAVASALANVLHYYVGEEQPYVWPDNWLIWVQTDATHNPIQTYIVEG